MHLFRSEEAAMQWCADRRAKPGAVMPPEQVWALSKIWYGNRLDPDYGGRSVEEAEAVFEQVGLSGSFWRGEESV